MDGFDDRMDTLGKGGIIPGGNTVGVAVDGRVRNYALNEFVFVVLEGALFSSELIYMIVFPFSIALLVCGWRLRELLSRGYISH